MKICPECRSQNQDTAKFCADCGKRLPETDFSYTPEAAAAQAPAGAVPVPEKDPFEEAAVTPKYIPDIYDKSAAAGFVLSVFGILFFIGVPFQIIGLILSIKGTKSKRRGTLAAVAIGFCIFGMICFAVTAYLVAVNYTYIVNSDFFAQLYYSLFY